MTYYFFRNYKLLNFLLQKQGKIKNGLSFMNNEKNKIDFSVIIPAFNEENFLSDAIYSIKNQIGNFKIETIVVNNNSTDKTDKLAESLGARVIEEKNKGVAWARKTGTENAVGEFVVHIDADSRLPVDYLKNVCEKFRKDESLVCLGGQMYFYDGVWWQNILRPFFHYFFWIFSMIFSFGKIGPMGNNMVFKKEVYDKTDGFDWRLKFGEDMDLCKKLSKFGKIKLDMSLKIYVSARRYQLDKDLAIYVLNFLRMLFLGEPRVNELKDKR